MNVPPYLVFGVLCSLLARACLAHGDLDQRIDALTKRVAQTPDAPALHVERGDLHWQHGDAAAALRDYAAAQRLAPATPELDYRLARAHVDAGAPEQARAPLERHLKNHPDDARAVLLRAQLHAALEQWTMAAADYRHARTLVPQPSAHLYLSEARALLRAGAEFDDAAFACLDESVAQLGPLAALIQIAADAAGERGRHELLLTWLERLPPALAVQPRWLARRADALRALHRDDAALNALRQALASAQAQPPQRRATPAARALEARIARELETAH